MRQAGAEPMEGYFRSLRRLRPLGLLLFGGLGFAAAIAARPVPDEWTVVLSGDTDGTLAPCGCTSPMTGGLQRLATALRGHDHQILIDNGSFSGGIGQQDVMKAQTAAQALSLLKYDAANLSGQDSRLGRGGILSLAQLSAGRVISTSLGSHPTLPIEAWRVAGPFLIGGAVARPELLTQELQEDASSASNAAHRLVEEAQNRDLIPLLLFDGDHDQAKRIAQSEPALRLITYRATGSAPVLLEHVADCALATPGEHGKAIVRLTWREGRFDSGTVQSLGPQIKNDPKATMLYQTYLRRVVAARLLEKVDRLPEKPYSGSTKCGSCHSSAAKVWASSGHAHALITLERQGHGEDPECVRCHVVGLEKTTGFRTRTLTPNLANVGCESCHGAGAAHSAAPWKVRLSKVWPESCISCHSLDNSPNFVFARYWPHIAHGLDRVVKKRAIK